MITSEDGAAKFIAIAEIGNCVAHIVPWSGVSSENNRAEKVLELLPPKSGKSLRSQINEARDATSFLTIVNSTEQDYKLIWLDYEGKRLYRDTVSAQQTLTHLCSPSHPFLLETGEREHGRVFVAEKGYCRVLIKPRARNLAGARKTG